MSNKYTKGFSVSLIMREIQITATVRKLHTYLEGYYLKDTKTAHVGEFLEKLEPLFTVGKNA